MMRAVFAAIFLLMLCMVWASVSCMSGSGNLPDDNPPPQQDDDDGDDDDDITDDDTPGDDDAADDDDDDDDDDATPIEPDCQALADKVYDECEKELSEGWPGTRLTKPEAVNACELGGDLWECAEVCRQDNKACEEFVDCFNQCPGQYNIP